MIMKSLLVFLLSLFVSSSFGSDFVKSPIVDNPIVDSIISVNHLKKKDYILYTFGEDSLGYSSILFVKTEPCVKYWMVKRKLDNSYSSDSEYVDKSGTLLESKIFEYPFKKKCGVEKNEQTLRFVPPLSYFKLVIYQGVEGSFYFEDNCTPVSYLSKNGKTKYRNEWLKILKKDVDYVLSH